MDKKTFVITTDQNSDYDACMSPILCKYDYIQFRNPESVIVMNGHEKLYDEDALDRARRAGEDAAWNLARKIVFSAPDGGYAISELRDIFGYGPALTLRNNTFQEAADKIQKWEEEIRVGDVVKLHWGGKDDQLAVVTYVMPDMYSILLADGNTSTVAKRRCTKTGKTLGIAAMLVELNGKEEN